MRSRKRRNAPRAGEQIAQRIKSRLEELGWSNAELAERLELSEHQLSRLLSGNRHWTLRLLLDTARSLEVPVEQLDPDFTPELQHDLQQLTLRGDVPQLKVLHTFLQEFPRITDPLDLRALGSVLRSFSERSTSSE